MTKVSTILATVKKDLKIDIDVITVPCRRNLDLLKMSVFSLNNSFLLYLERRGNKKKHCIDQLNHVWVVKSVPTSALLVVSILREQKSV